ncbi:MAG: MFS transporter [unclassified Hahellaceae]|nr:MFS transporter [Hahellaceae bacterium]|tara:strand:+ start:25678 stop:26904 length:1227 start_codon:yes stop_codon:yes gene_type:complete
MSLTAIRANYLLVALGLVLILSWGSLYYSLAVLAKPLQAALGFSEFVVFGAFTLSVLVSGLMAPMVGRWIDRVGGRLPLALGSALAALAFVILASTDRLALYVLGWLVAGVAMSLCLYDPVFVVIHQVLPTRFRRSVTVLTLFGGFASTVFWPFSHWLIELGGWREALLVFAALHLFIGVPVHLLMVPKKLDSSAERPASSGSTAASAEAHLPRQIQAAERQLAWLAVSFASAMAVFGALSLFLIEALASRGFARADAVWLAAAIGPMQVLGRLVEWRLANTSRAVTVGAVSLSLLLVSVLLLNLMPPIWTLGLLFAAFYGVANGLLTVVRSTVPVELFGASNVGATLGRLARPTFIVKALMPAVFAGLLALGISLSTALWSLVGFAVIAAIAYGWLLSQDRRRSVHG